MHGLYVKHKKGLKGYCERPNIAMGQGKTDDPRSSSKNTLLTSSHEVH